MTAKWVVVGSVHELVPDAPSSMWHGDTEYVVWQDDTGKLCAANALCPHRGANLACGRVVNGKLTCPLHGWRFDARGNNVFRPDGQPLSNTRLQCYPVIEDGGEVALNLEDAATY